MSIRPFTGFQIVSLITFIPVLATKMSSLLSPTSFWLVILEINQDINLKTSLSGQNNLRQIQMGDSLMIKDSFVDSDWLTVYPSTRRDNFSWWNNNWFIGYWARFSLMSEINIIVSSPGLKYLLIC